MRVDNGNNYKRYKDFWEWLFADWHIVFVITVVIGYVYYLVTTREV